MTKIFRMVPTHPNAGADTEDKTSFFQTLTEASFEFARAALWPNEIFRPKEKFRCLENLSLYFQTAFNPKSSFIDFCETILIAKKHNLIPGIPEAWLDTTNPRSFKTFSTIKQIMSIQTLLCPELYYGLHLLARHYLDFTLAPLASTYVLCEIMLLEANEYDLAQLFRNAVSHLNFR